MVLIGIVCFLLVYAINGMQTKALLEKVTDMEAGRELFRSAMAKSNCKGTLLVPSVNFQVLNGI